MENKKDLKNEILKSMDSLSEVTACFSVMTDGTSNNVCIGGLGIDIINCIANMIIIKPEIVDLIKEALIIAKKHQEVDILNMIMDKTSKNECSEEKCQCKSSKELENIEQLAEEFFKHMLKHMQKN